jgi:3-methyladenine DNA glycosylase/8-oxoguanine DNA glycosylase
VNPTPTELRRLARADPALGRWMRRVAPFPGFPPPGAKRVTHHEALTRAIVFQQLATRAAETIHARACALTPGGRFPSAQEILGLEVARMRSAGLSAGKIAALRDLSERALDGRLRLGRIGRLPDEAVIEHLVQVRGIGAWSAQMFLLFRLGRLDVMAPNDLGLQEGLRILDERAERPTPRELEARAEAWRPLRSVASWTLWRIVEHERARAKAAPKARERSS